MRKLLLGTTAVVGAALMSVGVAQAQQAPSVRIGGFMFFQGIYANDDADRGAASSAAAAFPGTGLGAVGGGRVSRQRFDFKNEVEVHVLVTGKAANGLSYGAVIELQNDNIGAGAGSAVDLDEAYGFVSSPTLGTLRFGEEDSAASIMQVRVPTIAGMGPDGDWDDAIASANRSGFAPSILTGINDGNDATKIVYLSPQFFGFDFGVSYAPNSGEGERPWQQRGAFDTFQAGTTAAGAAFPGIAPAAFQRDRTTLTNEIAGALRYRGSFGGVGVAAGFGAMRADAPEATATGLATSGRDITAYTAGLNLTAFGFTVGGEYTFGNYSGNSVGRAGLARGLDSSSHYVLGVTYTAGPVSLGAYFGEGEQDSGPGLADREQRIWGIGTAYTLAPGLDLVAQYNNLRDRNGPAAVRPVGTATRDADVILVGARLAF